MVGEDWVRKSWMCGWVSISRWIRDPGSKLCWGSPQLNWVPPVLRTCACRSVHGYFWRYRDPGVPFCGMTNSGFLPLGIWLCHSWLRHHFDINPKDEVVCVCLPQPRLSVTHLHSFCLQRKAACVSARTSAWIFLTNDSFNAEENNLVFSHRQIHKYDTSSHDTVLASTQGKKKRTPAHRWLRGAIFLIHTLHGNLEDHSPGLEEDLSAVCRWNVTEAYL